MPKIHTSLLATCLSFAAPLNADLLAQAPPEYGASGGGRAATITTADLERRVGVLAHDSMGGRDTPSPGLVKAAAYVADEFRRFGLEPAMGDDFLQWYPLTKVEPGAPSGQRLVLRGGGREYRLDPKEEFISLPVGPSQSASGALTSLRGEATDRSGEVVVVLATAQTLGDRLAELRDVLATGAGGALVALDAPDSYVDGVRLFFNRSRLSVGRPDHIDGPVAIDGRAG